MHYCVYVYLDPRKSGKFTYENLNMSFLFEPFYVGMGKSSRPYKHLKMNDKDKNFIKINKIKKILSLDFNLRDYILIPFSNLSKEEAFRIEIKFIDIIGRKIKNTGSLTNISKGGDCGPGNYKGYSFPKTLEQRLKQRINSMGELNHFFGKHHTEETKNKIRFNEKANKAKSDYRKNFQFNQNNPFFGKHHTEETKKIQSECSRGELNPINRKYKITDPNNKVFFIDSKWKKFCIEHNIEPRHFKKILKGIILHYNNWTIEWINKPF